MQLLHYESPKQESPNFFKEWKSVTAEAQDQLFVTFFLAARKRELGLNVGAARI